MRKILMLMLGIFALCTQILAQNRTITGRITNPENEGIPNASVTVKGTRIGTVTGQDGRFSLEVPSTASTLVISSVGFANQEVSISGRSSFDINLSTAAGSLDEVVVTGYSRQKRSEYSGAGNKVEASKIAAVPSGSLDQILQGRSPGLLVTAGSGQPGANARVQIRGSSSISGGSSPLYILDGAPIEAGVFQALNPNDIESVDVLRDASATALYGNRGGSGVIVITTKKGRAGKTSFSYLGQGGRTEPGAQKFDMMNSTELLQFQENLGRLVNNNLPGWFYSPQNPRNANATPATLARNAFLLDSFRSINTDWRDVFMRTGSFQSHDINLSGGSGKTRFFNSLGYYKEEGIGIRSDMNRFSARSNIDHQTDRLTVSVNAYGGFTRRNFIESEGAVALANPFAAAYLANPYHKLFNDNGTVAVGGGRVGPNAYDRLYTSSDKNNQLKTNLNVNTNYLITKQINVGAFLGLDYRETVGERQINPLSFAAQTAAFPIGPRAATPTQTAQPAGGLFNEAMTRFFSYVTRGNLGYRNVFGGRHDIDLQSYIELNKENNRFFNYTGYGINTSLLGTPAGITAGNVTNGLIPLVGGSRSERSYFGAIGTAKYTLDNKYTLNLSVRRDGTSILPEENRFTTFYSVGATWNVLKETFAGNWTKASDLRLRASYGTSANAGGFPLGSFGYLSSFGTGDYIGGGQLIAPTNAGNPEARWERITTLNIGSDFGFFRNRLTGTFDVYNKVTDDNLVSQQLSVTSGFASQTVNAAKIRNRGFEVQLNGDVVKTRDFTWTLGGNIAYNENEVLDLGQVNEFEQGTSIIRVGLPLGSHYIVKWGGVDPATGRPLYFDKEGKITNTYSAANAVAEFGTFNAPWIGSFNTGVNFKGLALEAFFTFQEGFSRFNNQDFFQLNHAFATSGYNMRREMSTMWSKPGDITDIQSPVFQREFSSKDIQDASYIRFRNLNLSYTFNNNVIQGLKVLSGARLFLQVQNLYTWTSWTGFDPEDNNNIAAYEYPTPRTYTVGINVNFK
jgi:TonB-linked SusC/RagA family outer membrane protein